MRDTLGVRLGARLRERREALGWSQAQLAEAAGVTPNYVGVVERGEKLPTLETLEAFAGALGAPVGALVADEVVDGWPNETEALLRAVPVGYRDLAVAVLKAIVAEAQPKREKKRKEQASAPRSRRARHKG
jgi:transcriptional regulator with XRE-family HTH domain